MSDIPAFGVNGRKPQPPAVLNWSSCWGDNPPTIAEDVCIYDDDIVIGGPAEARNISIQAGAILFLRRGCRLRVGTLHVRGGATLLVDAGAEVIFAGLPFGSDDPEQYGNGLLVEGKIVVRGTLERRVYRLAKGAESGAVAITLDTPLEGGPLYEMDLYMLPPSGRQDYYHRRAWCDLFHGRVNSREDRSRLLVSAISAIHYQHTASYPADDHGSYLPHVANLARDVVFRSENPSGIRGHFLATGDAEVDIEGALFRDMGRTTDAPLSSSNRKGRYAVHLHHLHGGPRSGEEHRFRLVGCSIVDSRKWALAIHDSHCGLVRDNVVCGAQHAGIVTEDGSESFNIIENNFVSDISNGHAFWLNGVNNHIRNNVACSCWGDPSKPIVNELGAEVGGYGYWFVNNTTYATRKFTVPKRDGTLYTFTAGWQGVLEFTGNEAYTVRGGVYIDHRKGWRHALKDLRVWGSYGNVDHGIAVVVYDTATPAGTGLGVVIDGLIARGCSVDSYSNIETQLICCDIRGSKVGFRDRSNNGGLDIYASYFQNDLDILLLLSQSAGQGGVELKPGDAIKRTFLGNVQCRGMQHIRLDYQQDANTRSRVPVLRNAISVATWQGIVDDDFRIYFHEQHADFVVPATSEIPPGPQWRVGAPEVGLTNAQCWAKYKIAIGGAVAPATAEVREKIHGLVVKE